METGSQHSISKETISKEKIVTSSISGWTEHSEDIFLEWADKAMCYRWLHTRSYTIYSSRAARYTIPVIIMSTITGTANFAQDKFPDDYKVVAQMIIGTINIIAGILTTIAQYFKINELNESHRVSSISWSKFYQNIKVEMTKHPKDRKSPNEMLNHYKEEFDRLLEISPNIEDKVVAEFKKRFGKKEKDIASSQEIKTKYHNQISTIMNEMEGDINEVNTNIDTIFDSYLVEMDDFKKQKSKNKFNYLKKPDICDELVSISENRRNWYMNVAPKTEEVTYDDPEMVTRAEKRKEEEIYKLQITKFMEDYKALKGQYPLLQDIIDNKKDEIPIEILRPISISILRTHYGDAV